MTPAHPERILILAPYGRDAALLQNVLESAGLAAAICSGVSALSQSIRAGAAAAIVTDEALTHENVRLLAGVLQEQPEWSDFPLLLMTGGGETTEASGYRLNLLAPLGNLTLIGRPLRTATLISAVHAALRARRHQYQIRDHLVRARQAAEALRENEEKLTFAMDAARLGAWQLEVPSRRLIASPQCAANFGLGAAEELTYKRLFDLIHPTERERVRGTVEAAIRDKTVYEAEYRITRPDGETGWIFATGRPIYGSHGEPLRMVGVTLDVTQRRKSEEAVKQSEQQLRTLANSIPQLAWIAQRDGHIFWYNHRWNEYTGTTLEEMGGWGWQSVHDPQILPSVIERWRHSIATGEPFQMEFPLRGADGVFRWFLTRVIPVRDARGEVVQWFGTNTDIDELKFAESALRESEELAQSVIQSNPDCVELLDSTGHILLMNEQGRRLLGLGEAFSGMGEVWTECWNGEAREQAQSAIEDALAGKQARFQGSNRAPVRQKWWDVIVRPVGSPNGASAKLLCVSRDVTAARNAEEQLRQTAKLESLGVMAGGIAHDFNNLLTGILGNASILADCVNKADRPLAEDIVLAAERAAHLTRQMLAYSGKGRFEIVRMDLSTQVRDIIRLTKSSVHKSVQILMDLAHEPCWVAGDPGQIQQLIMNITINAAEALDGKPGQVVIRTRPVEVDQAHIAGALAGSDIAPGSFVSLEVTDNGSGMSEEVRSKIFDPFFTTKFTGRGLGLAAVSGIVRGHKGALRVITAVGEGTTFEVLLPAAPRAYPAPAPDRDRNGLHGQGLILLVDDEEMVQRTGAAALARWGYEVRVARDGREAVELFKDISDDVSLILLDMTMPVMSGEEALRQMRNIRGDVPVIVCSGYNEAEFIRHFAKLNVATFLQKPYTAGTLAETVKSVLESTN